MTYEELQIEYDSLNIKEMDLSEINGLKGLYVDGNIAIQKGMTSAESGCTLAEEIGHHETSVGNILDLSDIRNRKQELRARLWAYDRLIGLIGIVDCFKAGCQTISEMVDYLNVTEEFLKEALERYRQKYGEYVTIDNYIIYFEPYLFVAEIF